MGPAAFEATRPFGFFDYFRVPYRVVGPRPGDPDPGPAYALLRSAGGRFLAWPTFGSSGDHQRYLLAGHPIFARVVPDALARPVLARWGSGWRPADALWNNDGAHVASVWRDAGGNVVLPFDPGEVMLRFWSESYQDAEHPAWSAALRGALVRLYYAVRPAVPRRVQIGLRRLFSHQQRRIRFPAWPVEPALPAFQEWFFGLVADLAGGPVPWLDLWPNGHSWALVLTHDVETRDGLRNIELLRAVERADGYVSSWNFVPLRYRTPDDVLEGLRREGCEVGVHGLLHDGRDLGSLRLLRRRLPMIRQYAERWGAVGFRSPATQRRWEWMPMLGFDYDTSYHDTAPYEPQPGGGCSHLPYAVGPPGDGDGTVELPMTVPMDHTLFEILGHPNAAVWLEKTAYLRERGGMALVLTHPDYADDPRVVEGYRLLLSTYRDDRSAWRALPCEVASWWRRRAASTVEWDGSAWVVTGPAARDGRVRWLRPGTPALSVGSTTPV